MLSLTNTLLNNNQYNRWWAWKVTCYRVKGCTSTYRKRGIVKYRRNDIFTAEVFSMKSSSIWTRYWSISAEHGNACSPYKVPLTPEQYIVSNGAVVERNYVSYDHWNYPGWVNPYTVPGMNRFSITIIYNVNLGNLIANLGYKKGDSIDIRDILLHYGRTYENVKYNPNYIAQNGNYDTFTANGWYGGGKSWEFRESRTHICIPLEN